jgi:glycosyltransferase involved in cell wall biosynthesis
MGDLGEIEDYLHENGNLRNVRFVAVRPNILARAANFPNRKGLLVYSFYLAYRIWHAQAALKARELLANEAFDVVHYLCPIGYREPGFLWKLDKPYVWGPVGGAVSALRLKGMRRPAGAATRAALKRLLNAIQLATSRRVPKALCRADTVIAATTENRDVLYRRFGIWARHMPENAIPDELVRSAPAYRDRHDDASMHMIWIGWLDYRKSPDLLIDAMSRIQADNWHLDVVGDGPLASVVGSMAAERGLEGKITFHGLIPRRNVMALMEQADLHLITSMNEGNPTTVWEAMAAGVPTLSLDHSGMHDVLCDRCGVLVAPASYETTRDAIAAEIDALLVNPGRLTELAHGVDECRKRHLWSQRGREWLDVYQSAIARHQTMQRAG